MAYPLKLFATATYDEFISTLVAAGLLTFGLNAPRSYRVLTKVTTFTTTMWVVYRSSRYRERSDEHHASVQHLLYPERAAYAQHCQLRPELHGSLLLLYAFHQNADAG